MQIPFDYGGTISASHLVNRERELELLARNFRGAQNTILISPRRWGKSSLVNRALDVALERDTYLRAVRLDLLAVRTEEGFLEQYLRATLAGLGGTVERSLQVLREAAATLVPKLTFAAGPEAEVRVGFDWQSALSHRAEILELPQRLAVAQRRTVVVAIDEFQAVTELSDAPGFDAVLRSHWQHHDRVCHCLYGSKRHMMLNLFGSYGAPFYQFGDTHVLERIDRAHGSAYIVDRFARFGKTVDAGVAATLAGHLDDHSHYVQQIAQIAFGLTDSTCTAETAQAAYEQLLYQCEPFFAQQIAPLSQAQLGFLRAVLDGQRAFSSRDVLARYRLGSSANASKLKAAMQERELVQLDRSGDFEVVDPLFGAWLRGVLPKG